MNTFLIKNEHVIFTRCEPGFWQSPNKYMFLELWVMSRFFCWLFFVYSCLMMCFEFFVFVQRSDIQYRTLSIIHSMGPLLILQYSSDSYVKNIHGSLNKKHGPSFSTSKTMGGRASRPLLWRSWTRTPREKMHHGLEKKWTWPHNERPSKNCPVTIRCFYKETTFIQIRQIHSPEVLTVCPWTVPLLNPQQQKGSQKTDHLPPTIMAKSGAWSKQLGRWAAIVKP